MSPSIASGPPVSPPQNEASLHRQQENDGAPPANAILALTVFSGFVGVYLLSNLIYAVVAILSD